MLGSKDQITCSQESVEQPQARRPKVLFVRPRLPAGPVGVDYATRFTGCKYVMPPLGLMTLAGVITPTCDVEIRDENIGPVDYDTDADIVAITGFIFDPFHIDRMRALSGYFRGLGKLICMGGPVVNLAPEKVSDCCDVMFEGEGELTWKEFIEDYLNGSHKSSYHQHEMLDMKASPVPRIDLINPKDYILGAIQTTRGCPFTCEFCDIIVMYGRKVRFKSVADVMKEVQMWGDAGQQDVFFVDDNFVGNRPYSKELLKELAKFNANRKYPLNFSSQASIDMAKDTELLSLMREANFCGVFIGIESPRKASLAETLKVQNVHTLDLEQAIHTIQSYGIWVTGGMIVGFDHDDINIFDEQYEFVQKAGVVFPMMNVLVAQPRTPLWDRMKAAGRLYEGPEPRLSNIEPVCMTYPELHENYMRLCQRVVSYEATLERHLRNLEYMKDCTFKFDRPGPGLQKYWRLMTLIAYYVFTTDSERRQFFFDMIGGTMKLNPRAMYFTFRFLFQQIHNYRYFSEVTKLVESSTRHEAVERIPEQSVREVAAIRFP